MLPEARQGRGHRGQSVPQQHRHAAAQDAGLTPNNEQFRPHVARPLDDRQSDAEHHVLDGSRHRHRAQDAGFRCDRWLSLDAHPGAALALALDGLDQEYDPESRPEQG